MELVIPFYKPPKDWEKNLVVRVQTLQADLGHEIKVILVNDGMDITSLEAPLDYIHGKLFPVEIVHLEVQSGKGAALRNGLSRSSSERVILTDIDVPFNHSSIKRVLNKLEEGCDVVLGRRTDSYYTKLPLSRRWTSKLFNLFTKISLGRYPGDTQAGLKGLSKAGVAAYLSTRTNSFLADFEFVRVALKRKLKLSSVRIELQSEIDFKAFGSGTMGREFHALIKILLKKQRPES